MTVTKSTLTISIATKSTLYIAPFPCRLHGRNGLIKSHEVKLSLGQLFRSKFTTRPRLKFINTSDNVLELMTISLPYCHKSALSDVCRMCATTAAWKYEAGPQT